MTNDLKSPSADFFFYLFPVLGGSILTICIFYVDRTIGSYPLTLTTTLPPSQLFTVPIELKFPDSYYSGAILQSLNRAVLAALNRYFAALSSAPTYDQLDTVLNNSIIPDAKELGLPFVRIKTIDIKGPPGASPLSGDVDAEKLAEYIRRTNSQGEASALAPSRTIHDALIGKRK